MAEDTIVEEFSTHLPSSSSTMPLITVYRAPKDYPDKYVARLWHAGPLGPTPTRIAALGKTLADIRKTIPDGMVNFGRNPGDDPCIVETWL